MEGMLGRIAIRIKYLPRRDDVAIATVHSVVHRVIASNLMTTARLISRMHRILAISQLLHTFR